MIVEGNRSIAETERKVEQMAARLAEIYRAAADALDEEARAYFEQFRKDEERMKKSLDAGKITEKQYQAWRQAEMASGERYRRLQRQFTERLANVNEDALAYINGEMPEVYATNYNDIGRVTVDSVNGSFGMGMSFDLVDEETVRILAAEQPDLLPKKKLDKIKDAKWNRKRMQAEILQGILIGEDIPTIAARLRKVTDMNEVSAVRNARTMVTSAQNRGRMESMRRTSAMGIVQKKHWMSSDQPGRTRDWHMPGAFRSLTVDIDMPFHNELGDIDYPGDPGAAPANVYNCRCTLSTEILGFADPVTGEYREV